MNDDEKLLRSVGTWRKKPASRSESVGSIANSYLGGKSREFKRNATVVDTWQDVLPGGFYEHCSLASISGGVMTLYVDPGPYMHELRLISGELLGHIQERCPQAGIRKISLIARKGQSEGVE